MATWTITREAHLALIKLLIKGGLLPDSAAELSTEFESFLRSGNGPLRWFTERSMLDEDSALKWVSERLKIPLINLDRSRQAAVTQLLENPALTPVLLDQWQTLRAVPIEVHDRHVMIAFANPLDHQAVRLIEHALGKTVRPALVKEGDLCETIGKKLALRNDIDLAEFAHTEASVQDVSHISSDPIGSAETTLTSADLSAPIVVKLVNKILSDSIQARASDIHLTPEKDSVAVKIRVDGTLRPLFSLPNTVKSAIVSRIKLLGLMDIAERRRPQDGRLRVKTASGPKDLRLSSVPSVHGESIVIRILSSDIAHMTLDALGADEQTQLQIRRLLKGSSRVILVVGPTGSGKTSTLYACLGSLRDGTNNIITIEDPIEYRIDGITQIQVNPKVEVTFAEGLRSILRQDPDVIMVGEVRDADTAGIALQAAQTGHLVLSTLHSNSAAAAVTRLCDLGVAPYLISSSLGAIVAQRLVRKLCPHCAAVSPSDLSPESILLGIDPNSARKPVGCEECAHTGFQGRQALFSILELTEPLRTAIRDGKGEHELETIARAHGFISIAEAAIRAINRGETTQEEVERSIGVLEATDSSAHTSMKEGALTASNSSGVAKRRILLVEDDENTRMVLSMLLEREMFTVDQAADGLQALEQVYQQPPELIVCDLMMPRMGGLEFVQRLRKDKRVRTIPVLMLTAADAEQNELSSLSSGADDFVSKTTDSRVMLARVHRLLDRAPGEK